MSIILMIVCGDGHIMSVRNCTLGMLTVLTTISCITSFRWESIIGQERIAATTRVSRHVSFNHNGQLFVLDNPSEGVECLCS